VRTVTADDLTVLEHHLADGTTVTTTWAGVTLGALRHDPGLLFPIVFDNKVIGYQVHPDRPRMKGGKEQKFESCTNAPGAFSYTCPEGPVPAFVVVTEGPTRALACAERGLACIALNGIDGAHTAKRGVKESPWLSSVRTKDVQMIIVPDADMATSERVQGAVHRLAKVLMRAGAQVTFSAVPQVQGQPHRGLDDYLAEGNSIADIVLRQEAISSDSFGDEVRLRHACFEVLDREGQFVPVTNFVAVIAAQHSHSDAEGDQPESDYLIRAELAGVETTFTVPAADFAAMGWVDTKLGAQAAIKPRAAPMVQFGMRLNAAASEIPVITIYGHTGWRRIGESWVFLHAGGAIGTDEVVLTELNEHLDGVDFSQLPDIPDSEVAQVVVDLLGDRELAPMRLIATLVGATFAAICGFPPGTAHLKGATGTLKSSLTALVQNFTMPASYNSLPASWSMTATSAESLLFHAKDLPITFDDLQPKAGNSATDVARLAERIFRGTANQTGRARADRTGEIREARPPRGRPLSTGEIAVPDSSGSLRARVLTVDVQVGDISLAAARRYNVLTDDRVLMAATASFIEWEATHHDPQAIVQMARNCAEEIESLGRPNRHGQTNAAAGTLLAALRHLVVWADEVGAAVPPGLDEEILEAVLEVADAQAEEIAKARPSDVFISTLSDMLSAGRVYLAGKDDGPPPRSIALSLGWTPTVGSDVLRAGGSKVGWWVPGADGAEIYLIPSAVEAEVRREAEATGQPVSMARDDLRRHLADAGLIEVFTEGSTGKRRYTGKVRVGKGAPHRVMVLTREAVAELLGADSPLLAAGGNSGNTSYKPSDFGPACVPTDRKQVGCSGGYTAEPPETVPSDVPTPYPQRGNGTEPVARADSTVVPPVPTRGTQVKTNNVTASSSRFDGLLDLSTVAAGRYRRDDIPEPAFVQLWAAHLEGDLPGGTDDDGQWVEVPA
jgi:hypothetical protein